MRLKNFNFSKIKKCFSEQNKKIKVKSIIINKTRRFKKVISKRIKNYL